MEKLSFNIYLLDEMSYPMKKYNLEVNRPITEESVRHSLEKVIKELTLAMVEIEKEEDRLLEIRKSLG